MTGDEVLPIGSNPNLSQYPLVNVIDSRSEMVSATMAMSGRSAGTIILNTSAMISTSSSFRDVGS